MYLGHVRTICINAFILYCFVYCRVRIEALRIEFAVRCYKMKVNSSDLYAILSLFFVTAILGEEHQNGDQQQGGEEAKKDPIKLVKDVQ